MSNLNVNNIDVQRIINVLNELSRKIQLCSFLTFKTKKNIEENKDLLKMKINNEEFWSDVEKHFQCMMEFRANVIELEEEKTENDKNSDAKDEFDDGDEPHSIIKDKDKTELKNLEGINENNNEFTQNLSKSTRNICRKYYKEIGIIQEMEVFRMDPEIVKFSKNFSEVFLTHYISKSKMTKEEELSQVALNAELTLKINELQKQIDDKSKKYDNLKRERQIFKTNCNNTLVDIDMEMKNLRCKTNSELESLKEAINRELNSDYDKHEIEVNDLKGKLKEVTAEFDERKKKNEEQINKDTEANKLAATDLRNIITDYDVVMGAYTESIKVYNIDAQKKTLEVNSLKIERDKVKQKFETYSETFKLHEEKIKALKYESDMKIMASEWIQAQFKGFFIRKTQKKKYAKILAPLKKVVLIDPDDKNKKPGKGGKK